MINKEDFIVYVSNKFNREQLSVDKFKPDLWFVEVDCFPNKPYKLAIEISLSNIKVSTVDKNPTIDFSLYDHVFEQNKKAEDYIDRIYQEQKFV
jgi:hypothetical protein